MYIYIYINLLPFYYKDVLSKTDSNLRILPIKLPTVIIFVTPGLNNNVFLISNSILN